MYIVRKSSRRLITATILFLLFSPCYAGEFYKWTDENGNLHLSDSLHNVPAKYRNQIESKHFENPKPGEKTPPAKQPPADKGKEDKPLKKYEVAYTPYEGSAKRVIVSVKFNNSVTAPMAIDTGAPGTMISDSLAKKLGLFDEGQGRLVVEARGIGGSTQAIRSIIDTIQVGEAKGHFIPTVITSKMSDSFEGLLGMDFVSNYSITINSKRKVVVFEELPDDPGHPDGHDQEWWTNLYKEFASYRAAWRAYSESLEKKLRESLISNDSELEEEKEFADYQYREAEKLFYKLNRYAVENAVPMHWRQY
jgi:hypothetical protein